MSSSSSHAIEGISEQVKKWLEKSDPRSYILLQKLVEKAESAYVPPLSYCIKSLTGITISAKEAPYHLKKILDHKRRMELKLFRPVHIKTAAVDYYDQTGVSLDGAPEGSTPPTAPEQLEESSPAYRPIAMRIPAVSTGIPAPGYHQERLKEEMQRARRYKHALSAMMLKVDLSGLNGSPSDLEYRDKVLSIIDTMITKAIRTVDIRARHSDSQFMIILPNTNKREAQELAMRLLENISSRLHRLPGAPASLPLAIAVGQCGPKNDTSVEFIKRLEHLVVSEEAKKTGSVLLLE
jgi:diguanylate cyclase (GGDEF)-like protein